MCFDKRKGYQSKRKELIISKMYSEACVPFLAATKSLPHKDITVQMPLLPHSTIGQVTGGYPDMIDVSYLCGAVPSELEICSH